MTSPRPLPSTVAHLAGMVAAGAEGWFVISVLVAGRWVSRSFRHDQVDEAAQAIAHADAQGANVYVRTNLIGRPLRHSAERGAGRDTVAAPAFVADLDIDAPGHAPAPEGRMPLPADIPAAMAIVRALPPPSLEIHTGGGVHLWWLLDEPVTEEIVATLDRWADGLVELGRQAGHHVDRPDAARVLRPAGTHRCKPGITTNRVELVNAAEWTPHDLWTRPWVPSTRYSARDLLERLPTPPPATPPSAPRAPRCPGEIGPADAVDHLAWEQILGPLGYTFVGMSSIDGNPVELWRRPNGTSDYSIKCFPDGCGIPWSDQIGLRTGAGYSKWDIYVHLYHHGDQTGPASAIRARARELAR